MKNWVKAIICIAIPEVVGATAGFFTIPEVKGWYRTINKPAFNPPDYVFGPVWTTLYLLMGVSLYLVWRSGSENKRPAIILWSLQLLFNFLWSFIFFNQHNIALALAEIGMLWLFILFTIIAFYKISRTAAWLMVPYILWVAFAAVLNYSIWRLNP